MSEEHTNAVFAALEGQRNNALNGLVKVEAALTIAMTRIAALEQKVAELTPVSSEEGVA